MRRKVTMLQQAETWAPRVAPATPPGQEIRQETPEGGTGGDRPNGPTTSVLDLVDHGYIGILDERARFDLFNLAILLGFVVKRQGLTIRDAAKTGGRSRVGDLLLMNEVRRMRMSTLYLLADLWQVPRSVMDDIAAACPAAIAAETDEK
jgi:hypothetical protein